MDKFKLYECVKVSEDFEQQEIAGKIGGVVGFSQNKNGEYSYSVMIEELNECWFLNHSDLAFTGKMYKESDFY
jgi:hypothetical protein